MAIIVHQNNQFTKKSIIISDVCEDFLSHISLQFCVSFFTARQS